MKIVDRLIQSIRDVANYNPDVQVAPACILWPDSLRQWESMIATLQKKLPELFVLGEYSLEQRQGPAIWLRCALAGKCSNCQIPSDAIPILYLPGVSRQELRAVESCSDQLKPLAELQYRGVFWSQHNATDWTIFAFLKSFQGGLSFDVAQDNECKNAMQLALSQLLDEEAEQLEDKRLDKDYFNKLLTGGDPVRVLLQWLDQGEDFRKMRDENSWRGFVGICKSLFAFNPENDGLIKAAACLAQAKGAWLPVWERYSESPKRYPKIPECIRKAAEPLDDLFSNVKTHGGWPQWNEKRERVLRDELKRMNTEIAHNVRKKINDLEASHGDRRELVWAALGEAPLACALKYLQILAEKSAYTMATGTPEELVSAYRSYGWQVDDALLRALACVSRPEDLVAVGVAIRALYVPWVEESARHLQDVVAAHGYPGGAAKEWTKIERKPGVCYFFVDGLRLDIAKRLAERLQNLGCTVEERARWAAIPSVTATGKPAISPVHHLITGKEASADFEAAVKATGQSLRGGHHLKKLLKDNDWQILERESNGNPEGAAWCEMGDIDHAGHERGCRLAGSIDSLLSEIAERLGQLFTAGWKSIHVVTDHGWLLLPGGLPRTKLPSSLSDNTWGRCAALKPGALSDERQFPWSWNPSLNFALPDGVNCYKGSCEYAHGGVSLQECLTLELIVIPGEGVVNTHAEIVEVVWKGMRCTVAIATEGDPTAFRLDLRTHPGKATYSIVGNIKSFNAKGMSSVIVEDDALDGENAFVIVIDSHDCLVAQKEIIIGKESS